MADLITYMESKAHEYGVVLGGRAEGVAKNPPSEAAA